MGDGHIAVEQGTQPLFAFGLLLELLRLRLFFLVLVDEFVVLLVDLLGSDLLLVLAGVRVRDVLLDLDRAVLRQARGVRLVVLLLLLDLADDVVALVDVAVRLVLLLSRVDQPVQRRLDQLVAVLLVVVHHLLLLQYRLLDQLLVLCGQPSTRLGW